MFGNIIRKLFHKHKDNLEWIGPKSCKTCVAKSVARVRKECVSS